MPRVLLHFGQDFVAIHHCHLNIEDHAIRLVLTSECRNSTPDPQVRTSNQPNEATA